ncbi:hypothetical protein [Methanogenium cariaci]|jgi:divalent metal cation (Fe/Co/Zn/Cd) transporter|uniref:hypothetical protein n=1 Tax=Methanogenium cariaci TaxID=2197 RepID=UPI0007815D27|nr:hypothetical protein [Methanogenium cariaci]
MKRNHLILAFIAGIIAVLFGVFTGQLILMAIVVLLIALVLVGSDILQWVKTQIELHTDNECNVIDMNHLEESLGSVNHDISEIRQRLDNMDNRDL